MEVGLEVISVIADHAAVGAFLGASWGLATEQREALTYWFAWGTVLGGCYGVLIAFTGVDSW